VTTLIASGKERTKRTAARLGFAWGLGHATTLFAFGMPIVLFKAYLPEHVQRGAEATIGVVIVALAVWLLVRWRRGLFDVHVHTHEHGTGRHLHAHDHAEDTGHAHRHTVRARSPLQAFGIGLLHGLGGSAGVGILILAAIHNRAVALLALALFAFFTAVSMALLSTGFGLTLSSEPVRRSFNRIAPALGMASLLFGVWYALGALAITPYYF
jgi:ABC-type nickel/cobalt efflux system permease component RcnA